MFKLYNWFFRTVSKKIEDVYDNNEQFDHHQKSYEKNRQYRIKRFGRERVNLIKKFKRGNLLDIGCEMDGF